MSNEIYDFIEARLDEVDRGTQGMRLRGIAHIRLLTDSMRAVLMLHKNWPVLVTTPPSYEPSFLDDFDVQLNSYTMRMSQQMKWMEGQEYLKIFGAEPPTTPMLRLLATNWKQHVDFQPEWALTREEYLKAIGQPF